MELGETRPKTERGRHPGRKGWMVQIDERMKSVGPDEELVITVDSEKELKILQNTIHQSVGRKYLARGRRSKDSFEVLVSWREEQ